MKTLFYTLLFILFTHISYSQFSCGNVPVSQAALQEFPANNNLSATGGLIKVYFHIYNDNNGNGGYPAGQVNAIINRLNADFTGTGFSFFHNDCETDIVDDTALHNSADECDFFFQPDICTDGVHIHVKGDGAAFSLIANGIPGNEILVGGIGFGVQFATSGVMSHEMGHVLGLFHTFQGHCPGGFTDCDGNTTNTPLDPNGDLVADTPADRNTNPGNVTTGTCVWNGTGGFGCDNTITTSPTDNYMAYTQPTCMSVFTPGQATRMCNLVDPAFIHASATVGKPIPEYTIVDENGNPQDYFCLGDEVFLNACASMKETRYFIGIWEYEEDGIANNEPNVGYSRTDPFWIQGEAGCMMNLNDIWANFENYPFRAGYEYKIQFAVGNNCDGWEVKDDEYFTMNFPTPDYHYVDGNGNPKTEFCFGETVYMDGSDSHSENKYFLSIWMNEIGGGPNLGYSKLIPNWAQGEVGNMINLNNIWNNFEQDYFLPNYEYHVQLAVQGPCSNGWNVKEDLYFTVVCCDDKETCDADFTVSTEEDKDGNIIFNFNNSDESYYSHTWTVWQHPAQSTGPYNQVATSNSPHFEFVGSLGGCYTIRHIVETPCGTCCYTREICNEKGGLMASSSEVDCSFLCLLTKPKNLFCSIGKDGYLTLNWDEVTGATGYIVSMIFNDKDCCGKEGYKMVPYEIETEDNSVTLQLFPICMSWTVTPICGEEKGETSDKECFNYKQKCFSGKKYEELAGEPIYIRESDVKILDETIAHVYPNPSNGEINISVVLAERESIEQLAIVGLDGKVIENIDFEESDDREFNKQYNVRNDLSGIYFIQIKTTDQVIMKKIMIIE